ncbi:lectin-like domain-containing protein [Streptomyces abikoensis]|uniref:DUF11 domain-containing protein n=1 Tax=Streptomyces abikoensis TaxID=97398 RepID=A0ABW7TAU1_9ACTN
MSIFPYRQPFAGSETPPNWKLLGSARMTGQGWLSLTQARTFQAGTALLDLAFPSDSGISVQFDLAAYGGSGADGLSFFLIDGRAETNPGGPGGALGYACYHKGQSDRKPGVTKGYVGIGIDQYGSFSNPSQAGNGGPGQRPNSAVLRGSGNGYDGYQYLTGKDLPSLSLTRQSPTRVLLSIIGNKVTVAVREDNHWRRLIEDYDLSTAPGQDPLPPTLKLGFSASTGMNTNNYEVRDLEVTLPAEMPLHMKGPQTAQAGSPIGYTITVGNKGPNAVPDAKVHGKLPTEVTEPVFGDFVFTGGATAGKGTIAGGTYTQPLSLPVGSSVTMPLNGKIADGVTGSITCDGTVTSDTIANTSDHYSDSVTTTVTPVTAEVPIGMTGPQTAEAGKPITYRITVENHGPGAVTAAQITGTTQRLTGAKLDASQVSGGVVAGQGALTGDTFTQPFTAFPKGGKVIVLLTGTIDPTYTGDITATSKIDTGKVVNTSTKKEGSVTTTVALTAEVPIAMKGPSIVDAGKPITYQVTVENRGPGAVTAAQITGTTQRLTGAKLDASQVSGGVVAGQGALTGDIFTQPFTAFPKGGKAIVLLTGTIDPTYTGDITATSKIDTSKVVNTSPDKTGSVTTKVEPAQVDIDYTQSGPNQQSWPEEWKGYVWTYNFKLKATKNRICEWTLRFDMTSPGSKFNAGGNPDHWYKVVDDGAVSETITIQSPREGHCIEPHTQLPVTVWVYNPDRTDGHITNIRAFAS